MIKVGVVYQNNSLDTEIFDERIHEIVKITPSTISKCDTKLDAVVIYDEMSDSSAGIYNMIIQINESCLSPFIWIIAKEMSTMDRLVCFKLGVSGVFHQDINSNEIQLVIQNTISSVKKIVGNHSFEKIEKMQINKPNFKKYSIDENSRNIIVPGGVKIHLTELECRLILLLKENQGKVLTYEDIFTLLWTEKHNEMSTEAPIRIANIVHHLRAKLNKMDIRKYFEIETVRSRGYVFVEKSEKVSN